MSQDKSQSGITNRRRSYRFTAQFRVELAPLGEAKALTEDMRDFSTTGVRLGSPEPVPKGSRFELSIPDVARDYVLGGEVVWCRPEADGRYDLGIRFAPLDFPIGDRICTRIREIETYRRTIEDVRHRPVSPAEAAREWSTKFGSHC